MGVSPVVTADPADLAAIRAQFHPAPGTTYLDSATYGLPPQATVDALASSGDDLASIHAALTDALAALREGTDWLLANGLADPLDALAGAAPYLRLFSLVTGGWVMALQAQAAMRVLAEAAPADKDFYEGKVLTARFFCEQLLPQARALLPAVTATNRDLAAAPL